jgi:hypothetical protein
MRMPMLSTMLLCSLLIACSASQGAVPPAAPTTTGSSHQHNAVVSAANAAQTQNQPTALPLDPAVGQEIGFVYEAYLSPHQEPGEEKDTPGIVPGELRSTAPSLLRSERQSRGHGTIRFTSDLSVAYVDVQVEGVNPEDVVMFHIHCGRPDMLGPIIVDFALQGALPARMAGGRFSTVVTNIDIEQTVQEGEGLTGALTAGCPIVPGLPDKVKTIAGMEYVARHGELYFNLHTKAQTFYGDIRGQLYLVESTER